MERLTWPPENPTATTPSSSPFLRNFGCTMLVVVILNTGGIATALYRGSVDKERIIL